MSDNPQEHTNNLGNASYFIERQARKIEQLQSQLAAALAKNAELEKWIAEFTKRCEAGYNKLDWLDANERVMELEQRIKESQEQKPVAYVYSLFGPKIVPFSEFNRCKVLENLVAAPIITSEQKGE